MAKKQRCNEFTVRSFDSDSFLTSASPLQIVLVLEPAFEK